MWCFGKKKQRRHKALEDNMVLTEESNQALSAELQRLKQERNHLLTAHLKETQELKEEVRRLRSQKSALGTGLLCSTFKFRNQLQVQREEARVLMEACVRSVHMNKKYSVMVSELKEENRAVNAELQSVLTTVRVLEEEKRLKDSTITDAEQYIRDLQTRIQDQDLRLRREREENLLCKERVQLQEENHSRVLEALDQFNLDLDQFIDSVETLRRNNSHRLNDETDEEESVSEEEEFETRTQDLDPDPDPDLREELEENLLCEEQNLLQAQSQSRILEALTNANLDLEELNNRMQILGTMNSRLHDEDNNIKEEPQTRTQELDLREEMEAWAQWDKIMGIKWNCPTEEVPHPSCPCCPCCT